MEYHKTKITTEELPSKLSRVNVNTVPSYSYFVLEPGGYLHQVVDNNVVLYFSENGGWLFVPNSDSLKTDALVYPIKKLHMTYSV